MEDPLVSVDWLAKNIAHGDVRPVDGTWVMAGTDNPLPGHYIPGAIEFDINAIADPNAAFSHTLPSANIFAKGVGGLGLCETDTIVVYDRHGMRAAPRVWWMFKMFGHEKVYVLDGGLPAWIAAGHSTQNAPSRAEPTHYTPGQPLLGVTTLEAIKAKLSSAPQILDARSAGRFNGTAPEPRAGLRSGHIPGSRSLPYTDLIAAGGRMISLEDITERVSETGINLVAPIITSCGSGVTACVLALALYRLGARDISVYDGSWVEWGGSNAPISLPSSRKI